MGQSHRTLKVADRIKVVVANLLETKIKDPRLGFGRAVQRQLGAVRVLHHAELPATLVAFPPPRRRSSRDGDGAQPAPKHDEKVEVRPSKHGNRSSAQEQVLRTEAVWKKQKACERVESFK